MGEKLGNTRGKIIKGIVSTAMAMGSPPDRVGELFTNLDESTADALGYFFSGVGDGDTVRSEAAKISNMRIKK